MKILLIEADFIRKVGVRRNFFTKPSAPVLGLNYLASILRNYNHEVIVLDSLYEYIRTGFSSPIDVARGTRTILEKEKYIEFVGISITSPTRNYALNIAREIKTFNPKIKIAGGGPHVTILQEMFLERFANLFDFLVIGEGDKTLPELIRALEGKMSLDEINGIVYTDNAKIIKKANSRRILSEKEFDSADIVPFIDYSHYQKIMPDGIVPAISLTTTRGCPYRCAFCYSPHFWRKYRVQSPERVLAEIEYLVTKYKARNIRFQDDTFTFDKDRCLRIFEGIKNKGLDINLYMHTRFDCVDKDIIKKYAEAGGKDIYFGLESGSQKLRTAMDKNNNISNEVILKICKTVKNYGLNLGLWLIFGYPGETRKDVKITYEFIRNIKPDEVICNLAHVHPITPLFYMALKKGIYRIEDWLNKKGDFFPYLQGNKAAKAHRDCLEIISNQKQKQIRTQLETELDTIIY